MDAFALGLEIAWKVLRKPIPGLIKDRYASYDSGKGADFEAGKLSLEDLRDIAAAEGEPEVRSGKQEMLENILNNLYVWELR